MTAAAYAAIVVRGPAIAFQSFTTGSLGGRVGLLVPFVGTWSIVR